MRKLFKNLTKQQIEIGLYALVIAVLIVGAAMLLWSTGGVWSKLWQLVCAVVEPLAYGAMLAYVFNPIVTHVSHALKCSPRLADQGMKRRTIATVITVLGIVLVVSGLLLMFALVVANGISSSNLISFEDIWARITSDFSGFLLLIQEHLKDWGLLSEDSEIAILSTVSGITSFATAAVFAVIFMVYFLIDGERLFAYAHRLAENVLGDHAAVGKRLLDDADHVFSGYFRGQAIDACIVGLSSGIILSLVGVPFAPVIGVLTGIGNLIPYVGGPVGFGSIILVCLAKGEMVKLVWGVVAMAVIMFVDGNIINPMMLSDNVEVHPMLVVMALIAGGCVGGIAGMLVAVPVAAWLKIQLDRWMDKNEAKKALASEAAEDPGEQG